MLNIPGGGFATSGFTADSNISPNNQTFSGAVLAVLARFGLSASGGNPAFTLNIPDNTTGLTVNDIGPVSSGIVALAFNHVGAAIGWLGTGGDSGGAALSDVTLASNAALNLYAGGSRKVVISSNGATTFNFAASNGNITLSGPAATQLGGIVWSQSGQTAWQAYQPASSSDWRLYNSNTGDTIVCTNGGTVSIAQTLAIKGQSGGQLLYLPVGSGGVLQSVLQWFTDNNLYLDAPNTGTPTGGQMIFRVGASTHNALQITAGGGSIFSAPTTSQPTLTITGISGQPAVSCSATSGACFYSSGTGALTLLMNSSGSNWGSVQNDGANLWSLATANSSTVLGTPVLQWNANGNVTIKSPVSGNYALTVNGVSGTHSTQIQDSVGGTYDAGFLDVPRTVASSNYTTVMSDRGKFIYVNANNLTITFAANSSVAYPIGTTITVITNGSTGTTVTSSDNFTWLPTGNTGSRSLAARGMLTAIKTDSNAWQFTGVGIT